MKKIFSLLLTLVVSIAAWAEDPYYEVVDGSLSDYTITLKVTFPDVTTVVPSFASSFSAQLYDENNILMAFKYNNTGVQYEGNTFVLPLDVFHHSDKMDNLRLVLEKYSVRVDGNYITSDLTLYPKQDAPAEPPYFWVKNVSGSDALLSPYGGLSLEYTKDPAGTWQELVGYWAIPLADNEKLYLRATSDSERTWMIRPFSMDVDYAVGGDITSLLVPEGHLMELDENNDGLPAFAEFFRNEEHLLDASELQLPSTKLSTLCYAHMFEGCVNLTAAPMLPALELAPYCYAGMFKGCTRLNYIKALFTDWYPTEDMCTVDWLTDVNPTGTFEGHNWVSWFAFGQIPDGWTAEPLSSMDITVPETGLTTFGYGGAGVNWIIPEGMEGYITYMDLSNKLVLEKVYEAGDIVDNVNSEQAFLLKAKPGTYTLHFTPEVGKVVSSSPLMAKRVRYDLSSNPWAAGYYYFALSTDENGQNLGFYPMAENAAPFSVAPFQGYLVLENFFFPDGVTEALLFDTTGLRNVVAPDEMKNIFDLSGRKVNAASKSGLYIINGKKVIK